MKGRSQHGKVELIPYVGHGSATTIYLSGRVVENFRTLPISPADSRWRNLLNSYRRFNSRGRAHSAVTAFVGDRRYAIRANERGYFQLTVPLDTPLKPAQLWQDVTFEVNERSQTPPATAIGQVLIPPERAQFAVISDLDDTVIQSNVANLIKLARNTFLRNSHSRLPFAGVAAFYQALQLGAHAGYNPIFYVSNTPWNLYDLIVDFFQVRGIPPGALFLREIDLALTRMGRPDPVRHKARWIEHLLAFYPRLPFLLIGDSGEKDTELYLQIAQQHPGRIAAVYIRDVTGVERRAWTQSAIQAAAASSTEILLAANTAAAAEHAASRGFIARDALDAINEECAIDQ